MNARNLRYAYVSNYWVGLRGTFLTKEKIVLIPFSGNVIRRIGTPLWSPRIWPLLWTASGTPAS